MCLLPPTVLESSAGQSVRFVKVSLCNGVRDMRCTREQGPGAEACEKIEKEHSVAWSVPYFIPGGSDFMKENAQPATTVRGACAACVCASPCSGLFCRRHASKPCRLLQESSFLAGIILYRTLNSEPPNTCAGLCMGEGTLLANPVQVHALESQLALLAPDVAAAADTLRSLI